MRAIAAGGAAALVVLVLWGEVAGLPARRRVASGGSDASWWSLGHLTAARPWSRRPDGAADHAALLDELARRVRAGGSLAEALTSVVDTGGVPVAEPVRLAVGRHRRGLRLADACRPLADDTDPSLALTGATLCAVASLGGAAGRALDTAAAALRERALVRADVRAQAATARLSALVLVVLPVGFGGWTIVTDAAARRFVLTTPAGWAVAGTGLALDAVGAWWMRRLVMGASSW